MSRRKSLLSTVDELIPDTLLLNTYRKKDLQKIKKSSLSLLYKYKRFHGNRIIWCIFQRAVSVLMHVLARSQPFSIGTLYCQTYVMAYYRFWAWLSCLVVSIHFTMIKKKNSTCWDRKDTLFSLSTNMKRP